MTSQRDTNSDQIADTSQAGRSRQLGWGVGLLASGALIGAVLAGNIPAFAGDTSSPSPTTSSGGATTDGREHGGGGDHKETA